MFRQFCNTIGKISNLVLSENGARIGGGLLLTGMGMGLNVLNPYIFSQTIASLSDAVSESEGVALLGIELSPMEMVAILGTTYTLSNLVFIIRNLVFAPLAPKTTNKLVVQYMNHIMTQSKRYHTTKQLGDHINNLAKCWMTVPNVSTQFFTQLVPTVAEFVVAGSFLSQWYGVEIGLGLGGILGVYTIYSIANNNTVTEANNAARITGVAAFEKLTGTITNYDVVHTSNNLAYEMKEINNSLSKNTQAETNAAAIIQKIGIGQILIAWLGFNGLCFLASSNVLSKKYTVNDFIVISSYLVQFFNPLANFGTAANQLVSSFGTLKTIFNELEIPPEVVDRYPDRSLDVKRDNAEIKFENVSFHYKEGNPLLKNLTFTVKPGQKVALVGGSGSGKSTIFNLLFRYYDAIEGNIYINGQNIKEVSLFSLRSAIGIVQQSPALLNNTIEFNIKYGGLSRPGGVSQEDIQAAADAACLSDFVASLTEGYNTLVGEGGGNLSGGQKQRVAIARAGIKKPKILLLDEVTSALDSKTEKEVQANLDTLTDGVTTLVIAHRLATIVNADHIIVLDKGRIAEQGTHQQLLMRNGIYAQLWKQQNESASVIDSNDDQKTIQSSTVATTAIIKSKLSQQSNKYNEKRRLKKIYLPTARHPSQELNSQRLFNQNRYDIVLNLSAPHAESIHNNKYEHPKHQQAITIDIDAPPKPKTGFDNKS